MQALWIVFQILFIMPFLAFLAFAVMASLIGGGAGILMGGGAGLTVVITYVAIIVRRERTKLRKHIAKQGMDLDYCAQHGNSAIGIDQDARRIFAGNAATGVVLPYSAVANISIESSESRNTRHHRIIISTNDFDRPCIEVVIPGARGREAFEKLRVACGQRGDV
ncbi:hypothetical protein RSO41_07120 [Halomonas sp. I1]|uniref:hypothetical protein n=1 Tax=Halomonas sp. I1 TaxID=393536 RepID=UPI0028DFC7AA|nr:hypothetical protein [Halomonas sp. I1]MDT8894426.1 hypothetical protein [Halomonas sp. I1]